MNFRYIVLLLALFSYGLNAMDRFDSVEELDAHLQKITDQEFFYDYHIAGSKYEVTSFHISPNVQTCDLWSYKDTLKGSWTKLLRWNNPKHDGKKENKTKPRIELKNKAAVEMNKIVLPARPDQPGFFTIKNLTANEGWFEDKSSSQGTVKRYKKIGQTGWTVRNWFTVDKMQGDIDETATVDYKPREAENFTSLEVTVTENAPKNVKTVQTRINKTTCVSLLVGAVSAWLTWKSLEK